MRFNIVIPVYNSEQWISKTIESIRNQTHTEWVAVIINDGSTDTTLLKVVEAVGDDIRFSIVSRDKNEGSPLASIVRGTNYLKPHDYEVLLNVDGDDWLVGNHVFSYLDEVYKDTGIWMTYGQYTPVSKSYANYCQPLASTRTYRQSGKWFTSHLRTYRYKLFKGIRDMDLRDVNGDYYKASGDSALLYPMIEMAGLLRIKFIDKVLYAYNDLNARNEMKVRKSAQLENAKVIRALPLYEEF